MRKYDDIINLKRPASKHPKMSLYQRSAQFAPYSALTGYEGQVKETARLTDRRIELDQELKVILDMKIQVIQELISNKPELEVTYFIPDKKKDGGRYETILDNKNKIDIYKQQMVMQNGAIIDIKEIIDINSDIFKNINQEKIRLIIGFTKDEIIYNIISKLTKDIEFLGLENYSKDISTKKLKIILRCKLHNISKIIKENIHKF